MRVQLEGQSLRLRIDEAELARLLSGDTVQNRTTLPDGRIETQGLRLTSKIAWRRDDATWLIDLPSAEVRALSERLPSRDGLQFSLPTPHDDALEILFDIDVRDSTRKRLHKSSEGERS
ncbi:hypothetical protein [Dyella sp. 2HG41-7]|uniref:hypothetical protein n=1 Tax=Dyella sp. 2HG41-7 TaxID=2883239 RepID=UPI001F4563D5|nr:hypothetical protein [Dyella sp. 2HG41-7]